MQLRAYAPDRIRNVGLFSHGGAGKTSLAEALLFDSGALTRLGRVEEGTTTSDFDPDEVKRHISVSAAILPIEWRDHKINLIDAPGYSDFVGEIRAAMRAVDAAVILIDAVAGVQVGTEQVWKAASERGLSRLVYVNKMDRENADFARAVEGAQARLGASVVPLEVPIGAEAAFRGVVDVLHRRARLFTGADGAMEEGDVPAELADDVEGYRAQLVERIAENDDTLIEKFLNDEPISEEELDAALKEAVCAGALVPLLCGAATANKGIQPLLDAIVDYLPAPTEKDLITVTNPKTGGTEQLSPDPNGPVAALVFKTVVDRFGTMNYFRVFSGTVRSDSHLLNANKGQDERLGQLQFLRGKEQAPTTQVPAGDIGVVVKLAHTRTGDTLCDPAHPVVIDGIQFPKPLYAAAVVPVSNADLDKMGGGLAQLMQEDPTLQVGKDPGTGETILSGLGESHVQVAVERLKRKSNVSVTTKLPRVPYRETVAGAAKGVKYRHKKQTGGAGQFGEVVIDLEPLPDKDFEFTEKIFGGSVPKQYIPGVEKGVRESLERGTLAGYPVVNVKVTLTDGSYHPVDSSEMAFKIAASQAFKQAVQSAQPALLEPVMALKITIPNDYTGDIISDLNTKRAQVQGANPAEDGLTVIEAVAPLAEVQRYATDLRQLTQGQGYFTMEFDHYQRVPGHLTETIVAAAKGEEK
ncbi:MAG: elongation factor G [Chloroflexota bacterium]|nr:elongation factor G [Chloroflexota bacterium]